MDEQDFLLLAVLGRTRNITHAADELYITQSSISKRIRQLEEQFGVTLMLRSRTGVQFTPSGDIVHAHALNILHEIDTMRQELAVQAQVISGVLRIGSSINFALYRLPDALAAYNERYPAVATQITTANSQNIYALLLTNKIDIGIIRGEHSEWRGERIFLGTERICAITSEQDKGRDLSGLPQITRRADEDMERMIAQWLREQGIRRSPNRIQVSNTATCRSMVEHGLGWSIVPEICLDGFRGGILPLRFKNGEELLRPTFLMYAKEAKELPQLRAFVDIILEFSEKTSAFSIPNEHGTSSQT